MPIISPFGLSRQPILKTNNDLPKPFDRLGAGDKPPVSDSEAISRMLRLQDQISTSDKFSMKTEPEPTPPGSGKSGFPPAQEGAKQDLNNLNQGKGLQTDKTKEATFPTAWDKSQQAPVEENSTFAYLKQTGTILKSMVVPPKQQPEPLPPTPKSAPPKGSVTGK